MDEQGAQRPTKDKAFAYITEGDRLLIFRHPDFPEVGLQVPGGTVGASETPSAAALREAEEETGLTELRLVSALGERLHDMLPIKNEVHRRHFYHFVCDNPGPERWTHFETHPDSEGVKEPIKLEFCWTKLDSTDAGLVVDQGALLGRLGGKASPTWRPVHRRSFVVALAELIAAFRRKRAANIGRALSALLTGRTFDIDSLGAVPGLYAAFHHLFYSIFEAASNRSTERVESLMSKWESALADFRWTRLLVIEKEMCRTVHDRKFDSPLYVYEGDAAPLQHGDFLEDLEAARAILRRYGYDELVDHHLGMVVTLDRRERLAPTKSFTVSALPGTIFIDAVDDVVRLAELVLHESSHTWLNDALMALEEKIPADVLFWSPWKQTERPAYGILQAAFAFSQMIQFFADVLDQPDLSSYSRVYCRERLIADGATLRQALPQFTEALKMIANPLLRGLLLDECNRALQFNIDCRGV